MGCLMIIIITIVGVIVGFSNGMWDFVFLFIIGGVVASIIWCVANLNNAETEKKKAGKEYQSSLQRLKHDPNNPNLRESTLARGRHYSNLMRDSEGHTIFDEVALMNDINAACAGATLGNNSVGKVVVLNASKLGGTGVAQEIEKLGKLFLAGVINAEEFERGKTLFLGAPPDKAATAVDLLQNLSVLKTQGVLSQSEFNMKKWEILSERLLPGKLQAASLQTGSPKPLMQRAPAPALVPVPVESGKMEKMESCPHCEKNIPVRLLRTGKNYCPKCGNMFEVE